MMFFIRFLGYGSLMVLLAWGAIAQVQAQTLASPNNQIDAGVAALERGHYSIAMRAFRVDAEQGNAKAQNNIGYLYEQGLGVGQSYPEAMAWYRKAAAQQLPQAQFNIATLYFYGFGVEKNLREALKWLRLAAAQKLPEAEYLLGLAFFEGQGVRADPKVALDWFHKAALQGHSGAQLMAGQAYLGANEGAVDESKAFVWGEVALANGMEDGVMVRDYASYKIEARDLPGLRAQAKRCLQSLYKDCPKR
jgi:TPR repeat protein